MSLSADLFAEGWKRHQARDFRGAEEIYRRILRAEPRNGRVWFVLGSLCADEDRLDEAVAYMRQALEIVPNEPMGHFHLGNVLVRQHKYREAEQAYRNCLKYRPDDVSALTNIGFVLGEQGRTQEAKEVYRRVLKGNGALPETHHNLGNILRDEGKLDEALACYREALRLRPSYAKVFINMGVALVTAGDLGSGLEHLQQGVRLRPDFAEAHNSLGTAYCSLGRLDEALAEYAEAIRLKPDYADAHWNRALIHLLRGDYEQGWAEYEWRWKTSKHAPLPNFLQPRWDGSPLEGRTILLYAEQGLGDTLQFIRYAPLVRQRGGRVIVQCQDCLLPLLSRSPGIDQLAGHSQPLPAHDLYAPLLSLPALLGTTLETVPANVPYLFADPERVAHWRRELAPLRGLRVGIAWQGSTKHPWDRYRSVSLALFEPLARVPGVTLVSLQMGTGSEQVAETAKRFPVVSLGSLLDKQGAFTDTAAIMMNLDLVVSVDTSIGHLAGGLGVPVWLALHCTPDYRWLLGREDSPWYPTARLFRQEEVGDWAGVFRRIAEALVPLAAPRAAQSLLLVEVSAGELLDKITILQIKSERITDLAKLHNVRVELEALQTVQTALPQSPELAELMAQLKAVNEQLWDIEDAIRLCEREQDFGPRFIELARSIYRLNDRRAALKRAINERTGSRLIEEKSYADYSPSPAAP
jgi:tetratricopeptide (TPR) repeat protein